eukprot:17815-Heterococcus_DN1.PRE.4
MSASCVPRATVWLPDALVYQERQCGHHTAAHEVSTITDDALHCGLQPLHVLLLYYHVRTLHKVQRSAFTQIPETRKTCSSVTQCQL